MTERRQSHNSCVACVTSGGRARPLVSADRRIVVSLLTWGADLTEPVDIYSEWIDATEAAQHDAPAVRPAAASSSRAVAAAASEDSDDD